MTDYYLNPAISQSHLKALLYNSRFDSNTDLDLYYEEKSHFILGSAVDFLLTQQDKNFEDYYYVDHNLQNKKSKRLTSLLHYIYDNSSAEDLSLVDKELILRACKDNEYLKHYVSADKIYNKILSDGSEYYKSLVMSKDKQILSPEEYNDILRISLSLKMFMDSNIPNFITKESSVKYNEDDFEIERQLPIYFTYLGVKLKALLDVVYINHATMEIYPFDIKTTSENPENFSKAFKKFSYGIQASFYNLALQHEYPNYTIKGFNFIVETVNAVATGNPIIYKVHNDILDLYRYGGFVTNDGVNVYLNNSYINTGYPRFTYKVKGFEQALRLLIKHNKTSVSEFNEVLSLEASDNYIRYIDLC